MSEPEPCRCGKYDRTDAWFAVGLLSLVVIALIALGAIL